MPSQYLQPSDYAAYGLPNTTTAAQVIRASLYIDGYLFRPEGLLYGVDANGNPSYMTGLSPSFTLTATGAIAPGSAVTFAVTGPVATLYNGLSFGNAVILDRSNPLKTEACVISSIDVTNNTVTLQNVLFNHDSGTLLEAGLTIFEQLNMPKCRPIKNLSRWPVGRIIGGQGQLSYGRRGDYNLTMYDGIDALAYMAFLGGAPIYEYIDPALISFDPITGQIFAPASIYIAYYTQIRIYYIAGYTYTNLPPEIKQACANLVFYMDSSGGLPGNAKSYRAGDTEIMRGGGTGDLLTLFDADTCRMIDPYRVRRFAI